MKTIDISMTWTHAARVLAMVAVSGTEEGRREVAAEIERMGRIIDELQNTPSPEPEPEPAAAHPEYISSVPEGYDTVLGYIAKNNPEMIAFDMWDAEATQRDGFWCKHECNRRDLPICKVVAPGILQDQGITLVNAYPVVVLRSRISQGAS